MPIKDNFELLVTKNRLEEFQAARSNIIAYLNEDKILAKVCVEAISSMIEDLEQQISEYTNRAYPAEE